MESGSFDETNDGQVDSDVSIASDDDEGAVLDLVPVVTPRKDSQKRAWSPSRPLLDSSDEDESLPHGAGATPRRSQFDPERVVLSTFRPIQDQNSFSLSSEELGSVGLSSDAAVILILSPADTLSLLGTYQLTVLRGSVSLLGVTLHPSQTHQVFACRSSPIPTLEALAERGESSRAESVAIPSRVRPAVRDSDSVVVLQELKSGIEGLGRVVRTFNGIFSPSRYGQTDSIPLAISGVYLLDQPSRDIQPFYLPHTWEAALSLACPTSSSQADEAILTPPVTLIRGPKNSGKSTFARTLLNRLTMRYRKVAYLECDLGQSEFTPGGMVALTVIEKPVFGPPFTHPTLPHQAHYIGSTSPRSSPSHYLSAIQALIYTYRLDIQYATSLVDDQGTEGADDGRISDVIPLVVNTMGWTKGLGADLSYKVEELIEPTLIIELDAPSYDQSWSNARPTAAGTPSTVKSNIQTIEAISSSILSTRFTASDHRASSILSYFHAVFSPSPAPGAVKQVTASSWNMALPLCAQLPYEVDWSSAVDRVCLLGASTEDVVPSEILRVLNGAIVALVRADPDADGDILPVAAASGETAAVDIVPYIQGSAPPNPSTSTTLGLALIRAVSSSPPRFHVLTPVPSPLLGQCRVLVKGEMEIPIWGMLDFRSEGDVAGVERSAVPYLKWGKGEGIGGERRRVRRNLMRKGQM